MKKKVLAVLLTVAILSSLLVTAAGAVSVSNFTDVDSGDWFYEGVDFVSSKGYMIGVSETEFAPEYNMTRAMFVTVLARVAGAEVDNTKSSFDDVKANEWYTGSVTWAAEAGITTGVGGNNFAPEAFVTREDMATFMSRFVTWYGKTTNQTHRTSALVDGFTDEDSIREYAKESVEQCRKWGLINGYDNGAYGPQDFSTRAQVATVISRLYWLVNGGSSSGGHTYTDYTVEVKIAVPATINAGDNELIVSKTYKNVKVDGETTNDVGVDTIVNDLVTGENAQIIKNAITTAIKKATLNGTGRTGENAVTVSYNGETITIEITGDGDISATTTANGIVKSVDVTDNGTTGTAATTTEYEELVERLQNGGTITRNDAETLAELIEKAKKVTNENIDELIEKYVNGNPAYEQAIAGLDSDKIVEAVEAYATELEAVKAELDSSTTGSVTVKPIVITVAVDLGAYLDNASTAYSKKWTNPTVVNGVTYPAVSTKIETVLKNHGLKGEDIATVVSAAKTAYDANDPVNFVTDNGDGTLTIKSSDDYYGMITSNVGNGTAVYTALNTAITNAGKEQATFYANGLTRAEEVLENKDIKSLSINIIAADVFGAMVDDATSTDGVFNACGAATFGATFTASEELYNSIRETYGYLPETIPEKARKLFDEYTVAVTITETNH